MNSDCRLCSVGSAKSQLSEWIKLVVQVRGYLGPIRTDF